MSKFFKKCFWFLALLLLLNILYLVLLLNYSLDFKKVNDVSNFKNKNYEVLVFGNSMALDAIDAEYLTSKGLSAYNMSIAGCHISNSLLMLEDYLKHNTVPKMVVIGLSSSIGRGYLNKIAFKNPEVTFFYDSSLIDKLVNPPLLNFQWLAVEMFKILISKDHRNSKIVRGQWKSPKVIPDESVFKDAKTVFRYDNACLQEFITICKNNNIRVIPIELPGSNENRNSFPYNYSINLFDHTQLKLYNLNNYEVSQNIIDSKKDWLAHDHLNQNGGKKLTAFIYENILKKEKIISKN